MSKISLSLLSDHPYFYNRNVYLVLSTTSSFISSILISHAVVSSSGISIPHAILRTNSASINTQGSSSSSSPISTHQIATDKQVTGISCSPINLNLSIINPFWAIYLRMFIFSSSLTIAISSFHCIFSDIFFERF